MIFLATMKEKGKIMKIVVFVFLISFFIGCGSKGANHIPILQLPGAAVSTGIENAIYGKKRKKVALYALENYDVLKLEIKQSSGTHLDKILNLAKIKSSKTQKVKQDLQESFSTIFENPIRPSEAIMDKFSKLYWPKTKVDNLNGFTFLEASRLINSHVKENFENLRADVKNTKTTELEKIASKLNIKDSVKFQEFIHVLDGQYYKMFVEMLVVSVMIHSD